MAGDITALIGSYLIFLQGLLDIFVVQQVIGLFIIVGVVHLLKRIFTMWG